MSFPILQTKRLILRAFEPADAPRVQALAGAREVALTTLSIAHPYEDGMAEQWIAGHGAAWENREHLSLAITSEEEGLMGAMGLVLAMPHRRAEIGYWIGVPYWGRGLATEAAMAVIDYGFRELELNRIVGQVYSMNPASSRVLEKVGMTHEGTLRQHIIRFDALQDVKYYAILASEWLRRGGT